MTRLRPSRTTSGFTLLELLLALAMSVVLFGVLFTALDLYWRFSLTGQEEVTRSQIARSVFNRMSSDIRSTIYRAKPKVSPNDTSTSTDSSDSTSDNGNSTSGNSVTNNTGTGTASTGQRTGQNQNTSGTGNSGSNSSGSSGSPTTTPTEPMMLSDAYSGQALGVFGDETSLVMHVVKPDRLARGTADVTGSQYTASDIKAVGYYLGDSSGSLATMFGLSTGGSPGLTRVSADRLSLSLAGANVDLVTAATKPELLAPEIESISFSYFDGVEWLSGWDSEVEGRLPNAIGVSITFRAPSGSDTAFISRSASSMTDSFRIVVTLPTSNPFEGFTL